MGIPIDELKKYDLLKEVPLSTSGGFMKADVMLVLKNEDDVIVDVIIIENKLSKGTAFTERQKEGFGAIINGQSSMKVYYEVDIPNINNEFPYLIKDIDIPVSKNKIFRFYDGGTDNINNVTIELITKVK